MLAGPLLAHTKELIMAALKEYKAVLNGHETVLLLTPETAARRGLDKVTERTGPTTAPKNEAATDTQQALAAAAKAEQEQADAQKAAAIKAQQEQAEREAAEAEAAEKAAAEKAGSAPANKKAAAPANKQAAKRAPAAK